MARRSRVRRLRSHGGLYLLVLAAACGGQIAGDAGDPPGKDGRPATPLPGQQPTGGTGGSPVPPGPAACKPPSPRLWRLTPDEYSRTIQALLPGFGAGDKPGDELVPTLTANTVGFSDLAGTLQMSPPHVAQLFATTRKLVAKALQTPAALAPCLEGGAPTRACVDTFLKGLLPRAFRRAVRPDEVTAFLSFYDREAASASSAKALEQVMTAVLMSPHFLYRAELGTGGSLSGHERAVALSYWLTDAPPDADLTGAAERGELASTAQREAQARRLLARPEARSTVMRMFSEWLDHRAVASQRKDAKLYPEFTTALAGELAREADQFLEHVLWTGDGKLSTMLTADFSMVNKATSVVYGLSGITSTTPQKTTLPAKTRSGLLTMPALLALLARENESDAVKRGHFVREALLCDSIPDPPLDVNAVPPPPDGVRTQRERLAKHSEDASCVTCHKLMDPIGLGLENYDAIGRHRTTELGKPVDVRGVIVATDQGDVPFEGAIELGRLLSTSAQVRTCVARRVYEFSMGRPSQPADACAIAALSDRLATSGGQVLEAFVAVAGLREFVERQP
jgi:hypothetical protein